MRIRTVMRMLVIAGLLWQGAIIALPTTALAEWTPESWPCDVAPGAILPAPVTSFLVGEPAEILEGYFTYGEPPEQAPPASIFTAVANWGDGTTSPATVESGSVGDCYSVSTPTHSYVNAGAYQFTYTVHDMNTGVDHVVDPTELHITRAAPSASITAPTSGGPYILSQPPPAPPTITAVSQSDATWREGDKPAEFSTISTKPPVGTVFSLVLDEQAIVSFSFTQRVPGREVGRECVTKSRKNAKRARCARSVTVGTLSFAGHSGTNKVVFQGRVSRSEKLKPGRYTLVITSTSSAGLHSIPVSLSFTIVT